MDLYSFIPLLLAGFYGALLIWDVGRYWDKLAIFLAFYAEVVILTLATTLLIAIHQTL